jgi:hypothetical protein
MRRALAALLAGAVVLLPIAGARAAEETPTLRMSSPSRAVAGQPIWVRSITPCPLMPDEHGHDAYQYVQVGFIPQSDPRAELFESTQADLFDDGSWEVTLSAPTDMPEGITRSYDIHAQCVLDTNPYWAPDPPAPADAETTTTTDPKVSIARYFFNRLQVTGYGSADSDPGLVVSGSTTTTTSTSTTSTTVPTPTTVPLSSQSVDKTRADSISFGRRVDDEKERDAEARRELASRGDDDGRDVTLQAASVATTAPDPASDGGAPWWSFVLATMLAVGAVVGYGAKKNQG